VTVRGGVVYYYDCCCCCNDRTHIGICILSLTHSLTLSLSLSLSHSHSLTLSLSLSLSLQCTILSVAVSLEHVVVVLMYNLQCILNDSSRIVSNISNSSHAQYCRSICLAIVPSHADARSQSFDRHVIHVGSEAIDRIEIAAIGK
jgi:hypothetical protein